MRACTPAPGAWTTFRDKRVKLGPVVPVEQLLAPGQLQLVEGACLVGTASTAVRLGGVRPEGRSAMPAADWLRGLRPEAGERCA